MLTDRELKWNSVIHFIPEIVRVPKIMIAKAPLTSRVLRRAKTNSLNNNDDDGDRIKGALKEYIHKIYIYIHT